MNQDGHGAGLSAADGGAGAENYGVCNTEADTQGCRMAERATASSLLRHNATQSEGRRLARMKKIVDSTLSQTAQAAHFRNELRAQVGALNDELSRAHADRAAAQGAIERLSRQLADSQAAMAMEARRQMEEQVGGFRGNARDLQRPQGLGQSDRLMVDGHDHGVRWRSRWGVARA